MDKLILVLYVDVANIDERHHSVYVQTIGKSMFTKEVMESLNATVFTIPRIGGGTSLECINPKFILDKDVYRDYRIQTDILIEHLKDYNKNV